jgi:penicillin amidase
MNMAQTLNMSDKDMEMSNALKMFGKETIDLLFPDLEGVSDPIVNNPNGWKFNPIKIDSIPKALPDGLIALDRLPESDPTTGSNNWAVAGSKTSTGSPNSASRTGRQCHGRLIARFSGNHYRI